jgi:hypothetical protein
VRLASLGPVGLPAALRRRGGDGRREARSAARATVPSVKAGRCLRALGAFRRPAVQAKSLLSTETTFDGTYGRTWSAQVPTGQPQRDEARYRRSTERDASGDVLSGHRLAALLVPLFPTGRAVVAVPYARAENDLCAVRTLRAYLEAAGIHRGPVFRRLRRGDTLTDQRLSDQVGRADRQAPRPRRLTPDHRPGARAP